MCCRFSLRQFPKAVAAALPSCGNADAIRSSFAPRYNIAPTQPVLAVRAAQAPDAHLEFTFLSWGLVPHWAKDAALAHSLFNARAESAAYKPSFKGPLRHHRCLIPADGFYEWPRPGRKRPDGHYDLPKGVPASSFPSTAEPAHNMRGTAAEPAHNMRRTAASPAGNMRGAADPAAARFFSQSSDEPFCFAALWEHWGSADGSEIESCALLTVAANPDIAPWHDRMPLVIPAAHYARWLDPSLQSPDAIADLLRPPPAGLWRARAVATTVNSIRNNGPECLAPPPPPRQGELF